MPAQVTIYTRKWCGYCTAAERLLKDKGVALGALSAQIQGSLDGIAEEGRLKVEREAVSKALGVLRSSGSIQTSRLRVVIRDLEALRERVR